MVAELSPPGSRGRYQGVFSPAVAASVITAPIAGTFVLDRFGGPALWLGCLAPALVVAAFQPAARPARVRAPARGERKDTRAAYKGP